MQTVVLTDGEIAERVAILKRFRSLLEQQRLKFREYLTVLEKQESSITESKTDSLAQHAELGEAIVAEIFTIQKVLDPLEYLYANVCDADSDEHIPDLKNDLAVLQEQVIAQNKKNREILSTQMLGLRQQIASLKRPYLYRESIYAASADPARFVDVSL